MKRGVIIAVIISVALSLPFYGLVWNRLMHVIGAILFMGNIVVSAVWFSLAKRSDNAEAVRFATRGIMATDVGFTTPGALLLLLNGGIMGKAYFVVGASWIFVALALFLIAAIIWLAVLVPLQKRMVRMAGTETPSPELMAAMSKWFRFGGIASTLALVTLILMVFKPTFW